MESDAALVRELYELSRGDLDFEPSRLPTFADSIRGLEVVRLAGTADFWSGEPDFPLTRATEALLAGLSAQGSRLLFELRSSSVGIEVYYGMSAEVARDGGLGAALRGAFGEVQIEPQPSSGYVTPRRHTYGAVATGIPGRRRRDGFLGEDSQVELVCKALNRLDWSFILLAESVPRLEVMRLANDTRSRIRDIEATYLLRGSPADQANRMAKDVIVALETNLARFSAGLGEGLWKVASAFVTTNSSLMPLGAAMLSSAFGSAETIPQPWRVRPADGDGGDPTWTVLRTHELGMLVRPPKEEFAGYKVSPTVQFGKHVGTAPGDGSAVQVGSLSDRGTVGAAIEVPRNALAQHAMIAGITGSGKTNACFRLLEQIWDRGRGTPFLVIEPAKAEYRTLLNLNPFESLRVFTVADERVSPLRINPLEVPTGILIQAHIDHLRALFEAAFVLYPPMPYVLARSLEELYADWGWDLASNVNSRLVQGAPPIFPSLSHLADKIDGVTERMGYDLQTTMNIKAGLLGRVTQLSRGGGKGYMLDCRTSVPLSELFDAPCVIELKQLANDDEKAFVMGLLLILLVEHREAQGSIPGQLLRHVTLIEEAHRLLRNAGPDKGDDVHANPRGFAVEAFANLLSEVRAYGEGLVVVEQVPAKLLPDVVKNTNLKLALRLLDDADRKLMGKAMMMDQPQQDELARLRPGQAVVYHEGLDKPILASIPLSRNKQRRTATSDDAVRRSTASLRTDCAHVWRQHPACESCQEHLRADSICKVIGSKASADVKEAGTRLFNAMRLNAAVVEEAYLEFRAAVRRSIPSAQRDGATVCALVGLVFEEIRERSNSAAWPLSELEEATSRVATVARALESGMGTSTHDQVWDAVTSALVPFRQMMDRRHRVEVGPYSHCAECQEKCFYQHDARKVFDRWREELLDEIRAFAASPFSGFRVFADFCNEVASRRFPRTDVWARRGAAFCVGVHALQEAPTSSKTRRECAAEFAATIRSDV
jgi:hypothetical protein